jgi:FkbM family methyltransferase
MTAIRYVRGALPGLPGEHDIAVLDGDTHIGRWVEESGRLDHDQNSLPRIAPLFGPAAEVWDVGAFVGDHSAFYAATAYRVLAIEAAPDAFACLMHNMRPYPRATCVQAAIGDGEPAARAGGFVENYGARYLLPGVGGVPSRKLDEFPGFPTLIKLDIEGWEVRALRGAERTIRDHHPIIVCEVNRGALVRAGTSPEELHALLSSYGYEMRDLFTDEAWQPWDGREQFDVVARVR